MKKIIFIASILMFSVNISVSAQENDTNIANDINNIAQSGQQLNKGLQEFGEKLGEAIETGTKAFGAALGEMIDSFTAIMTRAKICNEADKKEPITLTQAEEIVGAIIPASSQKFKIDTTQDPQMEFAVAEIESNNVTINVEVSKSYCLLMLDEMTSTFKDMPNKMKQAVDKEIDTDNITPNSDKESTTDNNSQGAYTIAGDEVAIEKFTDNDIKGYNLKLAVDEEKQNSYAFIIINTLGIKAKAHGENAQKEILQFFTNIDIDKIKQVLGEKSVAEI